MFHSPLGIRRSWILPVIAVIYAAVPLLQAAPGIRIVACDQKVPSKKRGVCANQLSSEDFRALAPGVSWFYNWHFESKDQPPADLPLQFIPMAWGNRPADLAGLKHYLETTRTKPPVVLAINEPNLRGQAFISPEETAKLYKNIKAVADTYKIPTVGPHLALGSPENDSIKAMDPIEKKQTTYTFMVPFLKAFLYYMGNTEVPAVSFHSYGNIGELKWAVEMMHKEFNRPVWVTEYAQWNTSGPDAARDYLIEATNFLETSPYVQGYAWFKERAGDNAKISLLQKQPGKLTPLGEAYVAIPPHDADLYYRIPGRLPAENYVASSNLELHPTRDTEGVFDVISGTVGATVDYNLQVDTAGSYTVRFRLFGLPSTIEILSGDKVLGSVTSTQKPWQVIETKVQLPAGPQTLRVRFGSELQFLNWIEFAR